MEFYCFIVRIKPMGFFFFPFFLVEWGAKRCGFSVYILRFFGLDFVKKGILLGISVCRFGQSTGSFWNFLICNLIYLNKIKSFASLHFCCRYRWPSNMQLYMQCWLDIGSACLAHGKLNLNKSQIYYCSLYTRRISGRVSDSKNFENEPTPNRFLKKKELID